MASTLPGMPERRTVLLDARFLGLGGAGRATALLLEGLRAVRPRGHWILWGPEAAREYLWDRATWEPGPRPTSLYGQRGLLRMPRHDVAIYMHQIRPLRRGHSVTLIHDTIPLRHGSSPPVRFLKRSYLRRVAALSDKIITVSDFSKRSVARDLRVDDSRIHVVKYPVDSKAAGRISAARRSAPQEHLVLYVGRFAAHKNLERLLAAFVRTEFLRDGGKLLLVGGTADEVNRMSKHAVETCAHSIQVRGSCSQDELEDLYSKVSLLIMPSLEEGFGLPVWEAMSCGLPVCVSDGGALPEIVGDRAQPFPAISVTEMAAAIDRDVNQPRPSPISGPTVEEFAQAVVAILAKIE